MSATSPLASDSRTDGTLSAITQSPIVGGKGAASRRAHHLSHALCGMVGTLRFAHPTKSEWCARGARHRAPIRATRWLCPPHDLFERRFHRPQAIQLHLHAVACVEPDGFYQTARE